MGFVRLNSHLRVNKATNGGVIVADFFISPRKQIIKLTTEKFCFQNDNKAHILLNTETDLILRSHCMISKQLFEEMD